MCQYRSTDGGLGDWHLVYLGRFAIGVAGVVFNEETAVEPTGRKTYDCAGLYNDDHVRAYRRINDFISMRFALELTEAMQAAWPADLPLFFRVSAIEAAGGVWVMEETLSLATALAERGVDVIDRRRAASAAVQGRGGIGRTTTRAGLQHRLQQPRKALLRRPSHGRGADH